jgi:uncharacterized protein GlcG (DUF336 family)
MTTTLHRLLPAAILAACALHPAYAQTKAQPQQPLMMTFRSIAPEAALRVARAALDHCAKQGYQVAVAVSDRAGDPLVMLRDRLAGPHTPQVAADKAYTALTFKIDTLGLSRMTQAGQDASGIRHVTRVVAIGGGRAIQAAGSAIGAVGVSGAPGGEADDVCAKAGIAAIADDLELAGP